jgi:hypothetical protein
MLAIPDEPLKHISIWEKELGMVFDGEDLAEQPRISRRPQK